MTTVDGNSRGPLHGVRVIELAGIGPSPFTAMLLADLGADVIRVQRPGYHSPANPVSPKNDVLNRSRRCVSIDLKSDEGRALVLDLVRSADVLLEGFRPGVTERLGLGPEDCSAVNEALVYGRMTGWGQDGAMALAAGHDINYISIAGALAPMGTAERPVPPLNLLGDFGGGGMLLALGVVAGVLDARSSGRGQVVDAAVVDGTALLTSMLYGFMAEGVWTAGREQNLLDGACHFYNVYECADKRWVAVGCIEPQFYAAMLSGLGLTGDKELESDQSDKTLWPALRKRLADVFATKTQAEWIAIFDGTDACVTPVVELGDVQDHPHGASRGLMVEVDGLLQPTPAPRFSRTPLAVPTRPPLPGEHTMRALADWGIPAEKLEGLRDRGVIVESA